MKRSFDLIITTIGLIILTPLFVTITLLLLKKLGNPILFYQIRPGYKQRPFRIFKFRTMAENKDKLGNTLPDESRMTSFGRILRRTSLDELPELWNVLKGDMSLVGPRPLLMEYLDRYTPEQARRHEVRPGITGWAQINGRNALTWEEKFELDVWYVDNRTFWLDIKILFLTVCKVFKREGISAEGHVTMPAFTGSVLDKKEVSG